MAGEGKCIRDHECCLASQLTSLALSDDAKADPGLDHYHRGIHN